MLGTNDARQRGRTAGCSMATGAETEGNLRAPVDLVSRDRKAAVTLITPPAVDGRRVDSFLAGLPLSWDAAAIADNAARVARVDAAGGGLPAAMQAGPARSDVMHPTAAGQQFIARRR